MKLNLDFNGKTLLKDWWKQVKTLFDEIETAFNLEESARINGDSELTESLDGEISQRTAADEALRSALNSEISEREASVGEAYSKAVEGVNAAADVQTNLNAESASRESTDSALDTKIEDEISKRRSADSAIDGRVREVENKAHTHGNRSVLDGISADDVAKWNGIKAQVTKAELDEAIDAEAQARADADDNVIAVIDERILYENDTIGAILNEIKMIYGAIGVIVIDGGLFEMEQNDGVLDGGNFDDAESEPFDCGDFEAINIGKDAVLDGGSY